MEQDKRSIHVELKNLVWGDGKGVREDAVLDRKSGKTLIVSGV